MATLLTVHGTNNSGPPDAQDATTAHWWQRSSVFEKQIRQLITSPGGTLNFEPFVWSGENNQKARWTAGKQLANKLLKLEAKQEPYCIIAHSHGGSVIAHALELLTYKNKKLEHLKQWITVGTPFIQSTPKYTAFNRIGLRAKSLLLLTYLLASWATLLVFLIFQWKTERDGIESLLSISSIIPLLLFLPPIILAFLVRYFEPPQPIILRSRNTQKRIAYAYNNNWTPINHSADEAILALSAVERTKLRPFNRDFATETILILITVAMFGYVMIMILSPDIMWSTLSVLDTAYGGSGSRTEILNQLNQAEITSWIDLETFTGRALLVGAVIFIQPTIFLFEWLDLHPFMTSLGAYTIPVFGFAAVFVVAYIWTVLMIFLGAASFVARLLSGVLSQILNSIAQRQISRAGLGGNGLGTISRHVSVAPYWSNRPVRGLPSELEADLIRESETALVQTLGKLRREMLDESFWKAGDISNSIGEHLSWKELIHTSYFRVPRFHKLVAFTITELDGFEATELLAKDPDYAIYAEWLKHRARN